MSYVLCSYLFMNIVVEKSYILIMTAKSNSITSVLDNIISKIEIDMELEQETASYINQSDLENTSNKRSKLSHDSMEDINCRICYDLNQELPVIYPCKCKVRQNEIL